MGMFQDDEGERRHVRYDNLPRSKAPHHGGAVVEVHVRSLAHVGRDLAAGGGRRSSLLQLAVP